MPPHPADGRSERHGQLPDHSSRSRRAAYPEGTTCEQVGKGLCTPGAEPCRRPDTDYPPIDVDAAAGQLNLPITVVGSDGTASSKQTQATVENGNVYVLGEDGKKHLVCELAQFGGDQLNQCATQPAFSVDAATSGGWCYTKQSDILGEQCVKRGAPGTVRFFGGAEPRSGLEPSMFCGGSEGC